MTLPRFDQPGKQAVVNGKELPAASFPKGTAGASQAFLFLARTGHGSWNTSLATWHSDRLSF
jgi:hypothetical protein